MLLSAEVPAVAQVERARPRHVDGQEVAGEHNHALPLRKRLLRRVSPRVSGFLEELRRRKVIRAATMYVAFALGVLGAAELILDPLGYGDARRPIVLLALAGFPLTVVLSWLFDLRSETPRRGGSAAVALAPGPQVAPRASTVPIYAATPPTGVRRLAAIMFADMVGYTALLQENEVMARESRDRVREVLTREIGARHGEIVQFYGDGALSIFHSAVGAVESAIAIQGALSGVSGVPVRIGIHIGDVVRDAEGAFGDGVNIASRIESLAPPGGVLISEKVYDEVRNQPHVETRLMGDFNLKNVRAPVPVHALANAGLVVPRPEDMDPEGGRGRSSIAVLPFVNMSADTENEYFSDGVTEELINLLTRINGLKVTARTSSFSFKGRNLDIREIGRELGVRHVLEGSVRRTGNRVRITAQLLDASNGYHLFSETYDRTVDDIFATQDEISETIVRSLTPALGGDSHEAAARPSEVISTEAHREYLKGLFHWARWTPEGVREAIAHFEHASEIDPGAALPHSGLATCYCFLGFTGQAPYDTCYPQARRHAETALALDASLGEAHVSLAMVGLFGEWDFDGAYAHFQKALSMTPGAAGVHHMYALYLLAAGETEAALQAIETAVDLDPLSLMMQQNLGWAYQAAGRPEEGVRVLQGVLDKDPHFRSALESLGWIRVAQGRLDDATDLFETLHRRLGDPLKGVADLGYVYAKQGRTEEAREMLRRLERRRERDPDVTLSVDFAAVHAGLGEVDEAVAHLREARDKHMAAVLMLPSFPPWDGLMDHPGLVEMYREIGRPV